MAQTEALRDRLRPESLDDVVGNEQAKRVLRRMLETKSEEHLLFHGPIGTGKTALAQIVANQIASKEGIKLQGGIGPAVWHMNASHYSGVDFIRELNKRSQEIKGSFFAGTYVVILDEAHALSAQAQTAMLSAMESSTTCFIYFFCTSELEGLLPALRRRCRKIELRPLSPEERRELVERAWKSLAPFEDFLGELPEEFIAAVQASPLGSPALILNALGAYHDGTPAKEAVAEALADVERDTEHKQPPLHKGRKKLSPEERDEQIVDLHDKNYSVRDIAKEVGCSPTTVQAVLKKHRPPVTP